MTNRPSVPEIITVNSEVLQTQIRDLLPSQNGFGSELQATNVITPIIDLTAAAEGSTLGSSLQQAWAHSTTTAVAANTTTTLINQTGFWKCFFSIISVSSGDGVGTVQTNDGSSTSPIFIATQLGGLGSVLSYECVVFLDVGVSIELVSNNAGLSTRGSCRQIATIDGTLVNPLGFSPS